MGSASRAGGARKNAEAVSDAYSLTQSLVQEHHETVLALHAEMLAQAPAQLQELRSCSDEDLELVHAFLDDPILIFRFYRRAGFDAEHTRSMLLKTLQWRLEGGIDALAHDLLHSTYMRSTRNHIPLFWMHTRFRDRLGRPCLYVRLQHVERTDEGLRELKTTVIGIFEVMRRYLLHINRRSKRGDPVVQCVTLIDVAESGLSNMELEMLPFFVDLLKNHYPGMSGAVYVLRYSWLHAGLWRMVRPVLPPKLLARLFFVDVQELLAHFDHAIPQTLGGPLHVDITTDSSDVFHYFTRAAAWRRESTSTSEHSHDLSLPRPRHHDYGSMYDVMSKAGSPYAFLTPRTSVPATPRSRGMKGQPMLQLHDLPTSPDAYRPRSFEDRRSSTSQTFSTLWERWSQWLWRTSAPPHHPDIDPQAWPAEPRIVKSPTRSEQNPLPVSDATSAAVTAAATPSITTQPLLPKINEDGAPSKDPAATAGVYKPTYVSDKNTAVMRYLSWRAHKYAEMDGHVSPYNIENPFFGYPAAYVDGDNEASSSARPTGFSRDLHVRRRKRDLVRTLSYLFVLRLIHLYRTLRRHARTVVWGMLGPRQAWASLWNTSRRRELWGRWWARRLGSSAMLIILAVWLTYTQRVRPPASLLWRRTPIP